MNTITVNTALLMDAIKLVFPVSQKRTTLPSLNHVLLSVTAGVLSLSATDSQNWVTIGQIPCTGADESFCIPARNLKAVMGSAIAEETSLSTKDGWVTIVSGRDKAKIGIMPADEFVLRPNGRGNALTNELDSTLFRDALELAAIACNNMSEDRNLVALEFRGSNLMVRAYGGSQYSQAKLDCTSDRLNVSIQADTARTIAEYIGGPDKVAVTVSENIIHVVSGPLEFTGLLSEWNLGSLDSGLKTYLELLEGVATIPTEALKRTLSASIGLFDERFTTITLGFSKDGVTVDYAVPGLVERHGSIEAVVVGPDASIKFQPRLLLNYISRLAGETITLNYFNERKPITVRQVDSDFSLYLIMPCMPD